jgi:hypothetical protein
MVLGMAVPLSSQAVDQRRGSIEVAAYVGVSGFETIAVRPGLLDLRLALQGDKSHEIGRQRGHAVVGREQIGAVRAVGAAFVAIIALWR